MSVESVPARYPAFRTSTAAERHKVLRALVEANFDWPETTDGPASRSNIHGLPELVIRVFDHQRSGHGDRQVSWSVGWLYPDQMTVSGSPLGPDPIVSGSEIYRIEADGNRRILPTFSRRRTGKKADAFATLTVAAFRRDPKLNLDAAALEIIDTWALRQMEAFGAVQADVRAQIASIRGDRP